MSPPGSDENFVFTGAICETGEVIPASFEIIAYAQLWLTVATLVYLLVRKEILK